MKMIELTEGADGYSHEVSNMFSALWHYEQRFKRLIADGHVVHNNVAGQNSYTHPLLTSYHVRADNPKGKAVKKCIASLMKLYEKAWDLTPEKVPKERWEETSDYVYELTMFFQKIAHNAASNKAHMQDAFSHIEHDEIPIYHGDNYKHWGTDLSGDMYVHKKFQGDPLANHIGELYDAIEHLVTIYHKLKDAAAGR